jgi:hypothetical protein
MDPYNNLYIAIRWLRYIRRLLWHAITDSSRSWHRQDPVNYQFVRPRPITVSLSCDEIYTVVTIVQVEALLIPSCGTLASNMSVLRDDSFESRSQQSKRSAS